VLLASFVVFTKLTREKYRKSSANNRIIVLPLSLEKRLLPFLFLVFFVSSWSLSSSSSSPPKKDTKHSTIVLARHPALAPSTPSLNAKADDLCALCVSTSLIARGCFVVLPRLLLLLLLGVFFSSSSSHFFFLEQLFFAVSKL
jgi:hypothetical protein